MKEPDYEGFWNALPHVAMLAGRADLLDQFRSEYREEIVGLLTMLQRVGLFGQPTSLHPNPPEECDLCGVTLAERQWFVDGETAEGAWASMCPLCFYERGHSLGWGRGQLYWQIAGPEWRLVSGCEPEAREGSE